MRLLVQGGRVVSPTVWLWWSTELPQGNLFPLGKGKGKISEI